MHVLVLGATGGIGWLVVEEALKRQYQVVALVRSPQKLGELASRIRVVLGDALDARAVEQAVTGQDAVIYALGAGNVRHTTLFSDSTRVLLTAMTQHAVRRLICVTGVGAGETKGHGGFLYDRILYPLFTKGIYADKDRQRDPRESDGLDHRAACTIPERQAIRPSSSGRRCRQHHATEDLAPRSRGVSRRRARTQSLCARVRLHRSRLTPVWHVDRSKAEERPEHSGERWNAASGYW